MRNGGRILVDQLALQGVDVLFHVPGESFLAVLDALYDVPAIRAVVCRHEGGAAMMAEAAGRLTGRPGVAFVTRAPGAANAVSGVYVAAEAQTPMILFVGLPKRAHARMRSFQDFDVKRLFSGLAKSVEIVTQACELPEAVSRAFVLAMSGSPGPVVIGLPEDMLMETSDAADVPRVSGSQAGPARAMLDDIGARLAAAEQPILIVGGPGWSRAVEDDIEAFALRFDLPVAAAFRAQDYIDNRHPSYCGHIGINMDRRLATAIRASDLLLVLGAPLDEIGTGGWSIIKSPVPAQHIIHIHPGGLDPRAGVRPNLQILATSGAFAAELRTLEPAPERPWRAFRRDLRRAFETTQRPLPTPGAVQLAEVVRMVSERLPESAILASGAGNYSQFVHRYFTYKTFGTSLAPSSGSMGYGLPAAIAAKALRPSAPVVAFAGDGCLMMTIQELATAVQYGLAIVVIVADNGMYGTIRMHQERTFPGRISGTSLVNPDFAALAESMGALGITVTETAAFAPAFEDALSAGRPALIHLRIDPEAITPQAALSALAGSAKGTP